MADSCNLSQEEQQALKLHPLYLFQCEIKDKNLKKAAFDSISTISISLGRKRTREQLIPFLGRAFIEENIEIKKLIIKGLTNLLNPIYIGKPHHSKVILELIMDIICVYSEPEIRKVAYECLEKVFAFMDVRKAQNILVSALKKLNEDGKNEPNIRDLIIKMIPCVYAGADGNNETQLLAILNGFKESNEDQRLLSENLSEFIKVMPPVPESTIRDMIELLLSSKDRNILANLICPIILLARISGEQSTVPYIKNLLAEQDPYVLSIAFQNFKDLTEVFSEAHLACLIEKVTEFESQPQEIKNAILEKLQILPVSSHDREKICEPPKSLQLKNTLSQTLCRVQDMEGLKKLFNSVDFNFQVKMFPKLPSVCEDHIDMLEKIMQGKSWRQKITILENIVARTEKGEQCEILLPKLFSFLGDKIASIRMSVSTTIWKIISARGLSLKTLKKQWEENLKSRNWFERQGIFLILENMTQQRVKQDEKVVINEICSLGEEDPVANIKSIACRIKLGLHQQ